MKSLAVQIVGWAFLGLGVIGLFLPVLQGILFIMIGLAILSTEYVWAHRWLTKLRQKFPALDRQFHRWKTKLARFFPQ
jgi:uncharacterized protein